VDDLIYITRFSIRIHLIIVSLTRIRITLEEKAIPFPFTSFSPKCIRLFKGLLYQHRSLDQELADNTVIESDSHYSINLIVLLNIMKYTICYIKEKFLKSALDKIFSYNFLTIRVAVAGMAARGTLCTSQIRFNILTSSSCGCIHTRSPKKITASISPVATLAAI